jgi:hypothetical protein
MVGWPGSWQGHLYRTPGGSHALRKDSGAGIYTILRENRLARAVRGPAPSSSVRLQPAPSTIHLK